MSRLARLLPCFALVAGALAVAPARALPPAGGLVAVGLPAGAVTRVGVPAGTVLAGVTWTAGAPEVSLRRLSAAGWQPWEQLDRDLAADGAERSRVRPGTEPVWLAGVTAVEVRVAGRARGARLDLVADPGPAPRSAASVTTSRLRLGSVVTRAGWGADERLRRGKPERARSVSAVVLHHTVTPDDYTPEQAASYVRSVYAYHTRSRGYDDIGYNLLVDRHGRVYEGRAGGFDRGVIGAHTAGFNTGTLGVALLGNFEAKPAAGATLTRVAGATAWAADRWRFDPRATVTLVSKGSPAYARGARVPVRRLAGHRDLGRTACPGRYAYAELPALRDAAWHELAAVITSVTISGTPVKPPAPLKVTAALDHKAAWRVTVTGPLGWVPARTEGTGTAAALTWNGTTSAGLPAPPGEYTVTITADDGVHGPSRPVVRTVQVTLPV